MNNRITGIMLKKDEPDREPDIYILFIITAIFVLIFGILIYTGAGAAVLGGFLIAYLALMLILLGLFSYLQVQCNPYSCNIIYYRGFLLFFLVLLFTTIQYCKGIFRVPHGFGDHVSVYVGYSDYHFFSVAVYFQYLPDPA